MNSSKLYWLLQLIGWGGMVVLEMINYTFFLVGQFSLENLFFFIYFAAVGITVTHSLKLILNTYKVFEKSIFKIWSIATISILVTSVISVVFIITLGLILYYEDTINGYTPIYVFGLFMNYGRYFLIWVAIYFLYKILEEKNKITQEKLEASQKARNFEFELLKKQINPHFLFNALNSIKALVLIDQIKSRGAIVSLSELLRYTLNYEGKQLVTIQDEVREVRKYLELEKLRYGERLSVVYEIDDRAAEEFIPGVSILTLAENAIKHGLASKSGAFQIKIKVGFNRSGLYIQVSNTGSLSIKENLTGIGLRNLKMQLSQHFAEMAEFSLLEEDGEVHARIYLIQNEYQNLTDRGRIASNSRVRVTT